MCSSRSRPNTDSCFVQLVDVSATEQNTEEHDSPGNVKRAGLSRVGEWQSTDCIEENAWFSPLSDSSWEQRDKVRMSTDEPQVWSLFCVLHSHVRNSP